MMKDEDKTKEQLINDLAELRQRIAELEASETERKQWEEALRESEERYRSLFEGAEDHIFVVDQDFRYVTVNPSALKAHGFTLEDVVGKGPHELFPEDAEFYLSQYCYAFETGEPVRFERDMRLPDGPYWFSVTLSPIKDAQGRVTALTGISRDITARKRAEEASRESQQILQRVVENMPVLFDAFDENGVALFWNKECERVTSYSAEEIVGNPKSLELLCPDPEYRAWVLEQLQKLGHEYRDWEIEIRRKDGETRTIAWSNISRHHPIPGWWSWGTGVDVTKRKRAEEQLRTLSSVVEQSTNSIAVLDKEGIVEYANPKLLELYQYSPEKVIGKQWRSFVSMDSTLRERIQEIQDTVIKKGMMWRGEVTDRAKSGEVVWREATIFPLKDTKGEIAGYVYTSEDITDRKRAEEQIKASLKEKEVLLKEIHHRVKNNLQVVSSLLRLQSEYVQDERSLKIFKESQDRVKSMALVHERLYQSKDLARIDFAEYVRSLAVYLFRSYKASSSAITLNVDVDDVSLGIDTAIPCGLIINELVSNALKHAFPAGREGEICINLRADDDELTLIVSDNGVSFPEDLDFHNTESLGLDLVTALTRQLEGTIELDRSGGTAFKITFARPTY